MVDSDDKIPPKAFDSCTSSSAISTPEENGNLKYLMKAQNSYAFLKSYPNKELAHTNLEKGKKQPSSPKCIASVEQSKSTHRCTNVELKKHSSHSTSTSNQTFEKQPRKCDHPVRLPIVESSDYASNLTCKNSACKAILSSEDTFCRRCSCCICYLFDDNKDPSLWLVCPSESGDGDWCGSSCHIECALQKQKVGVVDLGQFMQLDGSYWCASCGKVSGIIGCWKKQLDMAKDACQVDILCYRISLSYRLLYGTSKFKELHKMVEVAVAMLETEVGPVNGVSARMAPGMLSWKSIANDVQKQCSLAIEKAEEWLNSLCGLDPKQRDALPAACRFQFEEITSSSLLVIFQEPCSPAPDAIKGYKLWYSKSGEQTYNKDPLIIPRGQDRILISNLQPCTEYSFRIMPYTEVGDFGCSEAKCFTRSAEIIQNHSQETMTEGCSSSDKRVPKNPNAGCSGFRVRNLGRNSNDAWGEEDGHSDQFYQEDDVVEESCDGSGEIKLDNSEQDQLEHSVPCPLDLNVASVPDLNADLTTPMESSPEENGCISEKNGVEGSNGSRDSLTCATRLVGEVPAVESLPGFKKRSSGCKDACDGDSTLVNASRLELSFSSVQLDENYEYCIKVIRWLECLGHIEKDFRMKFLTWFSLRSTKQERWVVITFIRTFIEEPSSLAGQLLDSFLDIINCKRPRNGFCSDLWH